MSYTEFTISASGKASIQKDPDALLDYVFLFSEWLAAGDSIIGHQCVVVSGSAVIQHSFIQEGAAVVAVIGGGTSGETAEIRCSVFTAQGRVDIRRIYVKIKQA